MTTDLETSIYVKPNMDYEETGLNADPKIIIDMQYIDALNTGGLNGVTETVVSGVVNGTLGNAGSFVLDLANGAFKLNVAVDQSNPLGASVSLVNTATGLVIGGAVSLIFEIAGVAKVLSSVSKANLLSWITGTLITSVATDGINYEMVAALYKNEYKVEYQQAHITHDIIVNAGSSSIEDIKEFLYYSNVLKESDDVYVQTTDGTYKVVRGAEYNAIADELARRGFLGSGDASDAYFNIAQLNELEPYSGTYRQNIEDLTNDSLQAVHVYKDEKFLLVKQNDITFPFQGNDYDNIIYLDNKGQISYAGAGNDTTTGGSGNDTIYGDTSAYILGTTGQGNDVLYGGAGQDSILGELGNDTIYGGDGADEIHGGDDNDLIYGFQNEAGASETLSGSQGNYLYGDAGDDVIWTGGAGLDYVDGGSGNDKLHATGDKTATMFGNTGDDSIIGADGNDILNGGENDDTLYGNKGTDLLKGSEGDDLIYGGADNDTIYGGNDTLTTGAGKNDLYGDGGNDYIVGGDSNDYISGGIGNDILNGGTGNDMLIGGDGDDYLFDGAGTDWLIGGVGNDVYYMNYEADSMTIDFQGKSKNFGYITRDTIIDSDGQGSIVAGGITLTGGKQVAGSENNYSDNNGYTYTLSDSVLIISQGNFSFQVRDFSNGDNIIKVCEFGELLKRCA